MSFDFDKPVARDHTSSVKYDMREQIFGRKDVLPMWVADMDFETPSFVRKAITERARHPIYGYTFRDEAYYQHIINWFERHHQWTIEKDWILFSPGIVPALSLVVLALSQEGDEVIVQPPVYFPFFGAVKQHNRKLVYNTLVKGENTYTLDFDLLEKQATTAKILILCNPHNPVGRAWKKDELQHLASICEKHDLLVLSDEIHADLVLPGYKHQVFAGLADAVAHRTITAHAPSKTFNLAGLSTSSLIISNPELRKKVHDLYDKLHIGYGNLFGITASNAAFSQGDAWLQALLEYVQANVDLVLGYLGKSLPKIRAYKPEATYMIWLDFSAYNLDDEQLQQLLVQEAGLGLSPGIVFGPGGSGFMRMNLACPRETVTLAMNKLHQVFGQL